MTIHEARPYAVTVTYAKWEASWKLSSLTLPTTRYGEGMSNEQDDSSLASLPSIEPAILSGTPSRGLPPNLEIRRSCACLSRYFY